MAAVDCERGWEKVFAWLPVETDLGTRWLCDVECRHVSVPLYMVFGAPVDESFLEYRAIWGQPFWNSGRVALATLALIGAIVAIEIFISTFPMCAALRRNSLSRGTTLDDRGGPGCLNRFSASTSGASAKVRLPSGVAAG